MRFKINLSLSLVLVLLLPVTVFAQTEIGGEVKTKTMTVIKEDTDFATVVQEYLTLEVLIPQSEKTSAYAEVDLKTNPAAENSLNQPLPNGELISSVKKLYIKRKVGSFDVSAGRQPISWSFGSLLNPVDYNLGAEAMEETGSAKYVDAVEVYYPVTWNTSITAITSLTNGTPVYGEEGEEIQGLNKEMKYGLRGRTLLKGYDLTLNYVQQEGGDNQRLGATAKGDLGPLGVYGAGSYYFAAEKPVYLLGTDYSFFPGGGDKRLMMQLEYLKDEAGVVSNILSSFAGGGLSLPEEMDLILGMTSYDINDFANIKLMGIYYPEDGSGLVIPEYSNNLGSNLQFTMRGSWFAGAEEEVLGPKPTTTGKIINGNLEIELSYSF